MNNINDELQYNEIRSIYSNHWEARKIVEIPINDALRKPYKINGISESKIEILQKEANELGVNRKVRDALILERLDGGAAIFLEYDSLEELRSPPKKNSKIKSIKLLEKNNISDTNYNRTFSLLNSYETNTFRCIDQEVHKERLILLRGMSPFTSSAPYKIFSDSVLKPILDDIIRAVNIRETVYFLSKKASCIIASTENMMMADKEKVNQLANTLKNINNDNSVVLDADNVKLHELTTSFGALPELIQTYLKVLASALDVPITRFLGISNSGLTQSSDGDLENYYNLLQELQTCHIAVIFEKIYKLIYMSIFGIDTEVEKIKIEFPPLWNESDDELAKTNKMKIDNVLSVVESGLMLPEEAIKELNVNKIFATDLSTRDLNIRFEDDEKNDNEKT